ncbi:hypothetical protein PMSD_22420 [Paenibacillus macquariensis subsp. defensor]|nr:hypothetical protein PMSD_22420 [Paenibacillus macquariensis subsp. defensor]
MPATTEAKFVVSDNGSFDLRPRKSEQSQSHRGNIKIIRSLINGMDIQWRVIQLNQTGVVDQHKCFNNKKPFALPIWKARANTSR